MTYDVSIFLCASLPPVYIIDDVSILFFGPFLKTLLIFLLLTLNSVLDNSPLSVTSLANIFS